MDRTGNATAGPMSTAYLLSMPEGDAIPYRLERRQRKTIGMRITPEGLLVHAPRRISLAELERLLRSKAAWIRDKLATLQPIGSMRWQDGAELSLHGNPLTLRLVQATPRQAVEYEAGTLYVAVQTVDEQVIAGKVVQWYRKQALLDFSRRLDLLSAKLGAPYSRLFLSNADTRWGSCNSKGEIRLNWRLIQAPPHIINYVAAHELAHLKEMNHSRRFWAVVESLCPDYRVAEAELKAWSVKLRML